MWKAKPKAMILIPASKQKIPIKYGSVSSCRDREREEQGGHSFTHTETDRQADTDIHFTKETHILAANCMK